MLREINKEVFLLKTPNRRLTATTTGLKLPRLGHLGAVSCFVIYTCAKVWFATCLSIIFVFLDILCGHFRKVVFVGWLYVAMLILVCIPVGCLFICPRKKNKPQNCGLWEWREWMAFSHNQTQSFLERMRDFTLVFLLNSTLRSGSKVFNSDKAFTVSSSSRFFADSCLEKKASSTRTTSIFTPTASRWRRKSWLMSGVYTIPLPVSRMFETVRWKKGK